MSATKVELPKLASDKAYAAALAKRDVLVSAKLELEAELRVVLSQIGQLASRGGSTEQPLSAVDRAASALLGDESASLLDESKASLLSAERDLRFKIDAHAVAITSVQNNQVAPAKAEAQRKLVPAVFEQTWKPAMRRVAESLVAYHRGMCDLLNLAEQIQEAGLWIAPVSIPINEVRMSANDHIDEAATFLRAAVGEGYYSAGEAKSLLPGVKL